jgi:hypothetical protein
MLFNAAREELIWVFSAFSASSIDLTSSTRVCCSFNDGSCNGNFFTCVELIEARFDVFFAQLRK